MGTKLKPKHLHKRRSKRVLKTDNKKRLPKLTLVPKNKLNDIINDINCAIATISIASSQQTNQLLYSSAVAVTKYQRDIEKRMNKKTKWKFRFKTMQAPK